MRILIMTNVFGGLHNFRRELVEKLASENELICALPDDPRKGRFDEIGCKYIEVPTDRRGTNPITDYKLYRTYLGIVRKEKPDVVLTYTVKPNIYGGLATSGAGCA
ncbi:glycosyltransferase [Mesotoga sp.]|uniref:glycosyltransferase n=1 Tax=Mesotoga sp. TaxID=2053577 RepID=UPI00345E9978